MHPDSLLAEAHATFSARCQRAAASLIDGVASGVPMRQLLKLEEEARRLGVQDERVQAAMAAASNRDYRTASALAAAVAAVPYEGACFVFWC